MSTFQTVLSSITQVFGRELLYELEKKEFLDYSSIDWKNDREVLISKYDTPVKQQWNGTCTSFATIAAIENKLRNKSELSEKSLWDAYGQFSTREAIKAAKNHYILDEKYWPQHQDILDQRYKGKGRYKLVEVKFLNRNYQKVLSAIDNGNPCIVAMTTPIDLYKWKTQVEANTGFLESGHAVSVSGYKIENNKGYFYVKNSWGTKCGDKGYQYVAFELFNKNKGEYAVFWEVKNVVDRGEQPFDIFFEETKLLTLVYKDLSKYKI